MWFCRLITSLVCMSQLGDSLQETLGFMDLVFSLFRCAQSAQISYSCVTIFKYKIFLGSLTGLWSFSYSVLEDKLMVRLWFMVYGSENLQLLKCFYNDALCCWVKVQIALATEEWMFMKHWWIVIIRENTTYTERKLSQCRLVHHKSHVKGTIIEFRPPQCGVSD
jgi:hypothetical protein